MSEDLQAILLRGYALWNGRDFDALAELFDSDVEIDATRRVLNPARYRGIDGLRQFTDETFDTWEQWSIEPLGFWWNGHDAVVEIRIRARGRSSGLRLEEVSYTAWQLADGKAVRMTVFAERDAAFESIGLAPPGNS